MWTTPRLLKRGTVLLALPITAVLMLVGTYEPARADATSDRVVARVGSHAITVGEMNRRLGRVPPFQLAAYGKTPAEIKRTFLERVMIPEVLLAAGAVDQGLDKQESVGLRERDMLKSLLLQQLRDKAVAPEQVSPDDVLRYYTENKERYSSPARFAVWRILVATQEEAQKILAEVKKDPTPKTWTDIARDRSLDKSTNVRGGNLGFVTEQGTSSDGKSRVDAALVDAARQVKDGEFVDHPIPEGSGFAVVWRRGSMPAVNRSIAEEEPTIRRLIARQRSVDSQDKLIVDLKAREATLVNPSAVNLLEVSSTGQIAPSSKPGRVDRRPGRTAPEKTERGLR